MTTELAPLGGVETIPKFHEVWQWVKETFTPDYRQEVEAYLSDSVDIYDLEQRIKLLAKRGVI